MRVIRRRLAPAFLFACLVLAVAQPAWAKWYRVETDRFIVYGEGREERVRAYARKLQMFDATLRVFHPSTKDKVPATKLQLYLVSGESDLRRTRPRLPPTVAGYYDANNEGVLAVVNVDAGFQADDILFHEYAHHFMLENFPTAYPAWFVEGFAEYFATTEITPGMIKVGGYNEQRVFSILAYSWLPWDEVLGKATGETRRDRVHVYYGQAWLLTHYMRSDAQRADQLHEAIKAIAAGAQPVKAFYDATGMTPAQLTTELRGYRKLRRYGVKEPIAEPAMTVTELPESADAFLLDHVRLLLSVTGRLDQGFLDGVRRRAVRYPNDPFAQRTLARAEFVMGDVAKGEAIMKAQLEARPQDLETHLLAGMGQVLAGLRNNAERVARFRAARPHLGKAYALDNEDFRPLYAYTLSRSIEPQFPSDNDLTALLEARALAPSVQELSLRAGMALIRRGRRDEAKIILTAVANNPHGGSAAAQAKALIEGKTAAAAEPVAKEADGQSVPAL